MLRDSSVKGQSTEYILVIGAILISIAFVVGMGIFMVNSYVFNPQAKAIVIAQTTTAAANSLSMVEKGEFVMVLNKPVGIETYRNEDGTYIFKIKYTGVFDSDSIQDIEPIDKDIIDLKTEGEIFQGGEYETPFLCTVNEIKADDVNMIYVSKSPGENFVRVSNFRSKAEGEVSI